jgi:Putative bacterial sensory transduction regulator
VSAADLVSEYVEALPGETRRLGHAEWGITVAPEAAGGWPLDVGLRISDGLLRAQAFVAPANDAYNPWNFLHWNRQTRLVRFSCTRSGDIWINGDAPVKGLDAQAVDHLLGLVAEGALLARRYASELSREAL